MRKEIRGRNQYTKAKINMRNQANIGFLNRSTKLLCLLINQGGRKNLRKYKLQNQNYEGNIFILTAIINIKIVIGTVKASK